MAFGAMPRDVVRFGDKIIAVRASLRGLWQTRANRSWIAGAALVVLGLAGFALFVWMQDDQHFALRRPVPAAVPPKVEPVEFAAVTPETARALNAAVPFSKAPLVPARSLRIDPKSEGYGRARDCLAAAAWYEAGDDLAGERSVIQVVLNRVAHPAFPKSVCGVVFQGSERPTGCQFTFTCDGALIRRTPSTEAWSRARVIAEKALTGTVDRSVGLATHYHTDWVLPNWSGSLDKIAQQGTHLFFRFRGYWGQRAAYRGAPARDEPLIAKLAALSPAHAGGVETPFVMPKPDDKDILALVDRLQKQGPTRTIDLQRAQQARPDGAPNLKGNQLAVSDPEKGQFGLALDLNRAPGSYALVARTLCEGRTRCQVLGWRRGTAPSTVADYHRKQATALFSFRLDPRSGETALWDCREFPRTDAKCLPGTNAPAASEGKSE